MGCQRGGLDVEQFTVVGNEKDPIQIVVVKEMIQPMIGTARETTVFF